MRFLKRVLLGWFVVSVAAIVAAFSVKKAVPSFGVESDDSFSVVAVTGGRDFSSSAGRLADGRVLAVMGGADLDLSGATLGPGARLDLRAFMGGIDVTVPRSWRVEVIATERMGDVVNGLDKNDHDDDAPLLLVYANATMGGISIAPTPES